MSKDAFENAKKNAAARREQPTTTELVKPDEAAGALARGGELGALFQQGGVTPDLVRELTSGDYELSAQFVKLAEGDVIRGWLRDRGSVTIQQIDRATGEVTEKDIPTWTISDEHDRTRARFLSAHQLEEDLTRAVVGEDGITRRVPRFGEYVVVARLKDERTSKGTVVTRYQVGVRK